MVWYGMNAERKIGGRAGWQPLTGLNRARTRIVDMALGVRTRQVIRAVKRG